MSLTSSHWHLHTAGEQRFPPVLSGNMLQVLGDKHLTWPFTLYGLVPVCSVVPEMPSAAPSPQGSRARNQYANPSVSPFSCSWGPSGQGLSALSVYTCPGAVCQPSPCEWGCDSVGFALPEAVTSPYSLPLHRGEGWMKSFGFSNMRV